MSRLDPIPDPRGHLPMPPAPPAQVPPAQTPHAQVPAAQVPAAQVPTAHAPPPLWSMEQQRTQMHGNRPRPPAPPQPLPPATRGSIFGTAVLVFLLTISVGGIAVIQHLHGSGTGPSHDAAAINNSITFNAPVLIQSRHAVGYAQVTGASGNAHTGEFISMLMQQSPRPVDKLRTSMVIAQIQSPEDAAAYLSSPNVIDSLNTLKSESVLHGDAQWLQQIYASSTAADAGLTGSQLQSLRDRHGWFGDIVTTLGASRQNAVHAAALDSAKATFISTIVMFIAALLGLLTGGVLLVIGIVMLFTGHLHVRYARSLFMRGVGRTQQEARQRQPYLEAFTFFVVGFFVIELINLLVVVPPRFQWIALVTQLLVMSLCFWPLLRGVKWGEWRTALGIHRGSSFLAEIGCGLIGYLAGLPIMVLGLVAMLMLGALANAGAHNDHPIVFDFHTGWASALMLYLLACVMAPVFEELLFRGAFYHALRGALHPLIAGPIVGVIFAAVHPQGWIAIPVLGAIGFNFAMIREWRGSIIAPMTAHALNNCAVVTTLVLLTNI